MKKKITAICLALLLLSFVAAGSITYHASHFVTDNVITTGHVKLEVQEDFPREGVDGVLPGESVRKIVWVKNTGSVPAWVKVQVKVSIQSPQGEILSNTLLNGQDVVQEQIEAEWIHGEPGMYYYNGILNPGETTKDLMRSVYFDIATGNEYQGGVVHMDITAYGVQSEHNGTCVKEAQGWPR